MPAPILVALMGWEPHIVAEFDPTGFHEVPTDFHVPVHLPAHAPACALTRTLVLVPVHLPAHAPARALTCVPVPVPVHTNVSVAPLTAPIPAPVPAPVAPTAPVPIPVALMGWEPHIVAELDPTGFHEVPADFHAPCAPASACACACTDVRARAGARAHECLRRADRKSVV